MIAHAVPHPRVWVVVLAAGEGRRLSRLTDVLYPGGCAKQFASLAGPKSLLQQSLDRARWIAPPERTLVVVGASQTAIARRQLAPYPGVELVVQPRNLETAPGILLPLARVLAWDPDAVVVVLPSDHHVASDAAFIAGIRRAAAAVAIADHGPILVGVRPEGPEVDYGWIVPGRCVGPRLRAVHRFAEKPDHEVARQLLEGGGLWNTFVSVGRAVEWWELARVNLPRCHRLFERYRAAMATPHAESVLADIYARMEPSNFSRSILERAPDLSVLTIEGSGWCDWGTPRRVLETLRGTPALAALHERLQAACRMAAGGAARAHDLVASCEAILGLEVASAAAEPAPA